MFCFTSTLKKALHEKAIESKNVAYWREEAANYARQAAKHIQSAQYWENQYTMQLSTNSTLEGMLRDAIKNQRRNDCAYCNRPSTNSVPASNDNQEHA